MPTNQRGQGSNPLRRISTARASRHAARVFAAIILAAALTVSLVSLAPADTPSFPDVPTSHPYYWAITDLASRDVIGGYGDGNFGPEDEVMRQQFAKMIVLAGGYPVSEADVCSFSDVPEGGTATLYPDNYIAVCAANGITTGKTDSAFDPYSKITRYQVISMVVRMADQLQPGLLAAPPAGWTATGAWGGDPTHGAKAARAEHNGLLTGLSLSTLSPLGNMTRGEVAQVLSNLLTKLTNATTTTEAVTTTTQATTTTSPTTSTSSTTTTTECPP